MVVHGHRGLQVGRAAERDVNSKRKGRAGDTCAALYHFFWSDRSKSISRGRGEDGDRDVRHLGDHHRFALQAHPLRGGSPRRSLG